MHISIEKDLKLTGLKVKTRRKGNKKRKKDT